MVIPTQKECYTILNKYKVPIHIIRHSKTVSRVAIFIAKRANLMGEDIDLLLLEASCLLHDITKMQSLKTGEDHAKTGGNLVKSLGYPEVAAIIEEHIILKNPFRNGALTESEILNYSDKRVKHDKIVTLKQRFEDLKIRYGDRIGRSRDETIKRMLQLEKSSIRLEKRIFNILKISPDDLISLNEE